MNTKIIGKRGESYAESYLKEKNYKILDRNFQTQLGEIDIIAEDTNGCIAFVEVKYQSNNIYTNPSQKVNFAKIKKYKMVAIQYLTCKKLMNRDARFDVIEIIGFEEITINHIIDAFR